MASLFTQIFLKDENITHLVLTSDDYEVNTRFQKAVGLPLEIPYRVCPSIKMEIFNRYIDNVIYPLGKVADEKEKEKYGSYITNYCKRHDILRLKDGDGKDCVVLVFVVSH